MMCNNKHPQGKVCKLLMLLWLLSEVHFVWAGPTDSSLVASAPLRVTDYMMTRQYRYADKDAFALGHWYNGLSLSTFWYPKVINFQSDYQGWELNAMGLALTKDYSKNDALRLGFLYQKDRYELALDYQWNLTNFYYGYDAHRKWEWLATVGLNGGLIDWNQEGFKWKRYFYGGQVGLQLRHTLSPYVSLYVEPQYKATSPLYDNRYEPGNYVDDGFNIQVGLVTRLSSPFKAGGYGKAVSRCAQRLGDGTSQVLGTIGHGLQLVVAPEGKVAYSHEGSDRWYVQLLGGVQVSSPHLTFDDLRIYPAALEMNVGYRFNSILGIRGGFYEDRVRMTGSSFTIEETYGAQLELTAELLPIFWRASEEKGWGWSISAGGVSGRIETWDHFPRQYHLQSGWTAASQLRYRLKNSLWLVGQARMQRLQVNGDHRQLYALAGLQYSPGAKTSYEPSRPESGRGLWLSAAAGWWNGSDNIWSFDAGYDFTPVHGARVAYSYGSVDIMNQRRGYMHLHALGVDYLLNVSNLAWGFNPGRRLDLKLFAGAFVTGHRFVPEEEYLHAHTYTGFEGGMIFDLRLNRYFSLFAESNHKVMPYDYHMSPRPSQYWNMSTLGGLKLHF